MNFFKITTLPFFALSDSENQDPPPPPPPSHHHRNIPSRQNIPSPATAFSFSSLLDLQTPPNVLQSTTAGDNSGNSDSGDNASTRVGRKRPQWTAGVQELQNAKRLELCTEGVGFESSNTPSPSPAAEVAAEVEVVAAERGRVVDRRRGGGYPPVLTTLNWNGRPRFKLTKVAEEDGRLRMIVEKVDQRPKIVRSERDDGWLRMFFLNPDQDCYIHDDDDGGGSGGGGGGGGGGGVKIG